jgi:hypothetical protein
MPVLLVLDFVSWLDPPPDRRCVWCNGARRAAMMLPLRALPLRADKCGPCLVGTVSVGGSSAASVASSFDPTALQFSSIFRACLNYESNYK